MPSGDPCMELLFVVSCVRGDMTGDSCWEPDVRDDGLAAEVGGAEVDDGMVGRNSVLTGGFTRLNGSVVIECC